MTDLVNAVAFVGCMFLLIYWLLVSRKALGFALVAVGWLIILITLYSDHEPMHMLGTFVAGLFSIALLAGGYGLLRARDLAARRRVVYRPSQDQGGARRG